MVCWLWLYLCLMPKIPRSSGTTVTSVEPNVKMKKGGFNQPLESNLLYEKDFPLCLWNFRFRDVGGWALVGFGIKNEKLNSALGSKWGLNSFAPSSKVISFQAWITNINLHMAHYTLHYCVFFVLANVTFLFPPHSLNSLRYPLGCPRYWLSISGVVFL